mmetsp:Transcript_75670/g.227152  ORF Transcript_75670/g.227152 Transcript_75670/m.227152 type:complete len:147 (-) Transcript_75670:261-701(-)
MPRIEVRRGAQPCAVANPLRAPPYAALNSTLINSHSAQNGQSPSGAGAMKSSVPRCRRPKHTIPIRIYASTRRACCSGGSGSPKLRRDEELQSLTELNEVACRHTSPVTLEMRPRCEAATPSSCGRVKRSRIWPDESMEPCMAANV